MRNIWIVARRELAALFVQPIAYVFALVLLVITGLLFAFQLESYASATLFGQPAIPTLNPTLSTYTFVMLFIGSAVTMRLISEELKSGTLEVLMTLPVRDGEVVLGKFLASFIFYAIVTAFTLIYPMVLFRFGNPDLGPIIAGYLGTLLWGAAILAIGTFASALSENQIVSFVLGFAIAMTFFLIDLLATRAQSTVPALAEVISEISISSHLENFLAGLVTAHDILYYLLLAAIFLFAAIRVLESRRWR
jgi:ABC-2 type transport system permease protein